MTAKQLRPLTPLSRGLIKQLRDTKNACGFYEKHQKTVSREIVKKINLFSGVMEVSWWARCALPTLRP